MRRLDFSLPFLDLDFSYSCPICSAFRWCCMERGRKIQDGQLKYALYAQVVREGGLIIPTVMRISVIPGHCEWRHFSLKSGVRARN